MSLLREIQASLMEDRPIGPILLKLRFLASRLGSNLLEDWVKYESEGYPLEAELPEYRKLGVHYLGTFSGPFGSGVKNAPIPPYLIREYAGENWSHYEVRQSVSSIDELVSGAEGGTLRISTGNLMLLLQGNVYENYACNSVTGQISKASLLEIQNTVRARALELTIQIEKSIPAATEITVGAIKEKPSAREKEIVTQITNQVVHGNYTTISNTGHGAVINLNIRANDVLSVQRSLVDAGILAQDADEVAAIFASEKPESEHEPFGKKAKAWIAKNIRKATDGTWKVGIAVATQVLTEAALKYYGLK